MCTTYTGPMSAVVFVSLLEQPTRPAGGANAVVAAVSYASLELDQLSAPNIVALEEAVQQLQAFHNKWVTRTVTRNRAEVRGLSIFHMLNLW